MRSFECANTDFRSQARLSFRRDGRTSMDELEIGPQVRRDSCGVFLQDFKIRLTFGHYLLLSMAFLICNSLGNIL